MKHTRLIALFLSVMMAAGLLASCGGDIGSTESPSGTDSMATEDSPYDENGYLKDSLPDDLDFGGKIVNIYVRGDNLSTEFDAEQDGDIVNDAMFTRNQKIEERLNVDISYFTNISTNYYGDREIWMNTVRTSVMSNDGSIDIAAGVSSVYMAPLAMEGMFQNMMNNKYIDFDAPWWPQSLREEMTVYNKLYLASGDASLGVIKSMNCFFFNKDMIADYKLEDPYELVESGKWTIDKLNEMASAAVSDLNGNAAIDKDDQFGFIVQNENHSPNFVVSSGLRFSERDSEGALSLLLGSEQHVDLIDRVGTMMAQDGFYFKSDSSNDYANTFTEGRALFATGEFGFAEQYREVEFDFGIIPFPTAAESSDPDYRTISRATFTLFGISQIADADLCGAVLEAMGSESYRRVTPAYYEQALKVKYSRDDVSSQMFDLIKSGVVFDFAITYTDYIGKLTVEMRSFINKGQTGWATKWASLGPKAEALLEGVLESYASIE
ncbi:MAG: extracellular solute-binding protein [Ruminococcaceae bacterium]|nr:extracellular solute-binding protein [Oscillospiraceae bacterium]